MENNKHTNLIDALKEYNKSLSEQINRIKSFIEEIDKQISYQKKIAPKVPEKQVYTPFSRDYLVKKVSQQIN